MSNLPIWMCRMCSNYWCFLCVKHRLFYFLSPMDILPACAYGHITFLNSFFLINCYRCKFLIIKLFSVRWLFIIIEHDRRYTHTYDLSMCCFSKMTFHNKWAWQTLYPYLWPANELFSARRLFIKTDPERPYTHTYVLSMSCFRQDDFS